MQVYELKTIIENKIDKNNCLELIFILYIIVLSNIYVINF
jgi:hypothetical protein